MPVKVKLRCTRYDLPALINTIGAKIGAEIGIAHGYFSYYLLRHSSLEKLYSVDSYVGRESPCRADAEHYLSQFGSRSELLVMQSTDAAVLLRQRNVELDFCYIDANHLYTAVSDDIRSWISSVRPGGILAGHDYVEARRTGVIPAVDEFAESRGWTVFRTSEPWASWILFIPERLT